MQTTAAPKPAEKQPQPAPAPASSAGCDLLAEKGAQAGLPIFLQCASLDIGAPDDPCEREAESFAATVAKGRTANSQPNSQPGGGARRQSMPRLPLYQSAGTLKPPDGGQPIAAPLRTQFESSLGVDLGHVRIHSSAPAQAAAKSLHAKAFTNQNHIWLGPHQNPNDKGLIAHEVSHVVQQSSGVVHRGAESELGSEEDGGAFAVQRAPADYQHPEDGGEVYRRMQQRIAEETGEEQPEESASGSSSTARNRRSVDRAELDAKKAELAPEAKPAVDRPAAEQPRVTKAAQDTQQEVESPSKPPGAEKKEGAQPEKGKEGGKGAAGEAETAAALAEGSFAAADTEAPPMPEAAVTPPPSVAPVDAGGAPLPADPAADVQAAALAQQAQVMRDQGLNLRAHAAEERRNAAILRGNLRLVQQGVLQSEKGVERSTDHLTFRRGLVTQATQALSLSEEKAATVEREAPTYSAKADEGKAESGPMASESQSLSAENAANKPDDEEAAEKAQEQGGKIDQAGRDIATTDDAVGQTQTRAGGLAQEAAHAKEMNTQTRGKITNMNATLEQTNARLTQMGGQNGAARGEMAALTSQPDQLLAQANTMDEQGSSLIAASYEIEQQVGQTQTDFARGMQAVPAEKPIPPEQLAAEDLAAETPGAEPAAEPAAAGGEAALAPESTGAEIAVQRQPEDGADAAVATPAPPVSAPVSAVAGGGTPASLNSGSPAALPANGATAADATAAAAVDGATGDAGLTGEDGGAGAAGDEAGAPAALAAPSSSPAASTAPSDLEGRYEDRTNLRLSESVGRALPSWATGVPAMNEEERARASAAETERRQTRMAQIQARADQVGGFENLSAYDKAALALSMTRDNLFGSVGKIKWPGFGHLALGLIDPRGPLMGVVGGLSMTLSGAANLFNMEQWRRDPLGNLLKSAADIATGLTIILGSITALAGVIIAIMTAITILSFGTAAAFTGPVIAFCTTILTTVGGWTIAVGKVALILQALVFIKNLIDAATARTAQDLLTQADQMSEDVSNAGNVVLEIGMAKLAQVGGRAAAREIQAAGGGVRFAAGMGARFGTGVRALPGRVAGLARSAPGRLAGAARALPGRALAAARTLPGRALGGARALGGRGLAAARALPGRALSAARALPGRAVSAIRALPGQVARAPGNLVRGIRTLPGRIRQQIGKGFSREFLVGEDITSFSQARAVAAAERAAVRSGAGRAAGAAAQEGAAATQETRAVTQEGTAATQEGTAVTQETQTATQGSAGAAPETQPATGGTSAPPAQGTSAPRPAGGRVRGAGARGRRTPSSLVDESGNPLNGEPAPVPPRAAGEPLIYDPEGNVVARAPGEPPRTASPRLVDPSGRRPRVAADQGGQAGAGSTAKPLLYDAEGTPVGGSSRGPQPLLGPNERPINPPQTPARQPLIDPNTGRPVGSRPPPGDPSKLVGAEGQPLGLAPVRPRQRPPAPELPSRLPPEGPVGIPPRVQSRINLAEGRTGFTPVNEQGQATAGGWDHVVSGHFGGDNAASQFTLSQSRVREILTSPRVVSAPVRRVGSGRFVIYERVVEIEEVVGRVRAADGGGPTRWLRVYTDSAGNLISTFPVPAP